MLSLTLGKWDEAERELQIALTLDPLNPYVLNNLGVVYLSSGRFAVAERMFRKLQEVVPDYFWTRYYLCRVLLAQGRVDEAFAVAQEETDSSIRPVLHTVVLVALGRTAEADAALEELIAKWAYNSAYSVALAYAYRGDTQLALEWLERAYRQRESALTEILGEPLFKNLAPDPRFQAFLRKMNLPTDPVPENRQ